MDQQETSLTATFKTVSDYGAKYAASFPPTSIGGQQFALVTAAVTQTGTLGAAQVSGEHLKDSGVIAKGVAYDLLHADLVTITGAAHSLVLLGTAGLDGKFHLPRSGGDQALLNSARAFATDATPLKVQFLGLNLPADFLDQLAAHTAAFETAGKTKGAGLGAQAGATGGLADTTHKAAVALHVLDTIVNNTFANDPVKRAEWLVARHVEKHTPVKREKAATTPAL